MSLNRQKKKESKQTFSLSFPSAPWSIILFLFWFSKWSTLSILSPLYSFAHERVELGTGDFCINAKMSIERNRITARGVKYQWLIEQNFTWFNMPVHTPTPRKWATVIMEIRTDERIRVKKVGFEKKGSCFDAAMANCGKRFYEKKPLQLEKKSSRS